MKKNLIFTSIESFLVAAILYVIVSNIGIIDRNENDKDINSNLAGKWLINYEKSEDDLSNMMIPSFTLDENGGGKFGGWLSSISWHLGKRHTLYIKPEVGAPDTYKYRVNKTQLKLTDTDGNTAIYNRVIENDKGSDIVVGIKNDCPYSAEDAKKDLCKIYDFQESGVMLKDYDKYNNEYTFMVNDEHQNVVLNGSATMTYIYNASTDYWSGYGDDSNVSCNWKIDGYCWKGAYGIGDNNNGNVYLTLESSNNNSIGHLLIESNEYRSIRYSKMVNIEKQKKSEKKSTSEYIELSIDGDSNDTFHTHSKITMDRDSVDMSLKSFICNTELTLFPSDYNYIYEKEQNDSTNDSAKIESMEKLVQDYFYYLANGNVDNLQLISQQYDASSNERIIRRSEYIDSYDLNNIYIEPGLLSDSYVAFITFNMRLNNVNTLAPGASTLYIKEENGIFKIFKGNLSEKEIALIYELQQKDEIYNAFKSVDDEYAQAVRNDQELYDVINELGYLNRSI